MNRSATLLVWLGSGLLLYGFEVYWFIQWWGSVGGFIGLFVPPLAIVFPFIYLAKEGFSLFYFATWAVGLSALLIGSSPKSSATPRCGDDDDLD